MTMRRVLVTGASGFIGSQLVRHLARTNAPVHILCRPSSDLERLDGLRDVVVLHVADLRDAASVGRVVAAAAPDHVFHCAAATMHAGRAPDQSDQVATNLLGTVALLDACHERDVEAIINIGDAFEYGPADGAVAEWMACHPATFDGVTKLAATLYGRGLARAGHLGVVTIRPFSVVGPGDDPRRLVPRLVAAAHTGTRVELSDPRIRRDFVWIGDLISLCLIAATRTTELRGRILNCGSGEATTLGELVATVEAVTRRRVDARWGTFPVGAHDLRHPIADVAAARALGWSPDVTLGTMIERLWSAR